MGINLFEFYSIGKLTIVLLGILIFFTFFVKEPKDEKRALSNCCGLLCENQRGG